MGTHTIAGYINPLIRFAHCIITNEHKHIPVFDMISRHNNNADNWTENWASALWKNADKLILGGHDHRYWRLVTLRGRNILLTNQKRCITGLTPIAKSGWFVELTPGDVYLHTTVIFPFIEGWCHTQPLNVLQHTSMAPIWTHRHPKMWSKWKQKSPEGVRYFYRGAIWALMTYHCTHIVETTSHTLVNELACSRAYWESPEILFVP